MLKPSVTVVQSQHNADGSERRISLPPNFMMHGISGQNDTSMAPQQQQQHQQPGNNFVGAPQAQHVQQQHTTTQVRSVASSMDLSTSSLSGQFNRTSFLPPQQKHLFQSSSHHTSHTAAAGDLLSMSRRAFEPPSIHQQNSLGGKKRSSTISEDPGHDVNMNGMSIVGPQQQNNLQQQQQNNIGMSATPTDTSSSYNNGFNSNATTKLCNNVSSSTFASQGDADESYQHHRTIRRRCQRPGSFEMMEDD